MRTLLCASTLSIVALAAGPAAATVIYATGFENPPFTVAANIASPSQDGWAAVAAAAPGSYGVSNLVNANQFPFAGSQYVVHDSAQGTAASRWAFKTVARSAAQLVAEPLVTASTMVAITQNAPGDNRATLVGIDCYNDTGATRLGLLGFSNAGLVVGFNSAGAALTITNAPTINLGQYYELKMVIDYSLNPKTVAYFVDGTQVASSTHTATTWGDADLWLNRAGTGTGGFRGLYDNMNVEQTVVPEPAAMGLAMLVLGATAARRRSR